MGRQKLKTEASREQILEAALPLFSHQGYGATSMRQIADDAGLSIGNLYHHFGSKEAIFQTLIERYWEHLLDPGLRLNQVFGHARFPDDLEDMAGAIKQVVNAHPDEILLIYVDVIEFRGAHIRSFYESMADRFREVYAGAFDEDAKAGRIGNVDPLVAVMVATRWFFYFYTVEKCFGVPMHLGMQPREAVGEFIKILRYGVLPRAGGDEADGTPNDRA